MSRPCTRDSQDGVRSLATFPRSSSRGSAPSSSRGSPSGSFCRTLRSSPGARRGSCGIAASTARATAGGAFAKGRLCALLLRKGDPERFAKATARWTDLVPDSLGFLVPLGVGIALLVWDFSWLVLGLVLLLALASAVGNGVVRGSFTCRHCRQRDRVSGRTAVWPHGRGFLGPDSQEARPAPD